MTFHPHSPCLGWLMLLHVRGLLMCLLTDTLSSGPMRLLPFLAHHTFLLNSGTFHMLFHLEPSSPHHHSVRLLPRLLPCFKSSLSLQTRMNSFAIDSLLSLWVSPPASLALLGFHPSSRETRRTVKAVAPKAQCRLHRDANICRMDLSLWCVLLCSLRKPYTWPYCSTHAPLIISSAFFSSPPVRGGEGRVYISHICVSPACPSDRHGIYSENPTLVLIK